MRSSDFSLVIKAAVCIYTHFLLPLVGFLTFFFCFLERRPPLHATEDNYTKYIQERPLVDTLKKSLGFSLYAKLATISSVCAKQTNKKNKGFSSQEPDTVEEEGSKVCAGDANLGTLRSGNKSKKKKNFKIKR